MESENFDRLIEIYKDGEVCVFTGAGVSFTSSRFYKTPGWPELLREIYEAGKKKSKTPQQWGGYEELKKEAPDPWDFADHLIALLGAEEEFQNLLRASLIRQTGKDTLYKRLPIAYLKKAHTLNALLAFCCEIKYIQKHHCVRSNEKVKAVITLNYDWYFEGGATQKYNALPFKPMVDHVSKLRPSKLPVYHLHGYIPHDLDKKPRQSLIMSSKSYHDIYRSSSSWAQHILTRFVDQYTTIFIGLSFEDKLLVEHLEKLAMSSNIPHFFIGRKNEFTTQKIDQLARANIVPVWIDNFAEIPGLLKRIYLAGLPDKKLEVERKLTGEIKALDKDQYWKMLLSIKK